MAWMDWAVVQSGNIADYVKNTYKNFTENILGFKPATGQTTFESPLYISGTGMIYWVNENGKRELKTGTFTFSSDLHSGDTIFEAGGYRMYVEDDLDFSGEVSATSVKYLVGNTKYYCSLMPSNKFDRYVHIVPDSLKTVSGFSAMKASYMIPTYRYGQESNNAYFAVDDGGFAISNVPGDESSPVILPTGVVNMDDIRDDIIDQYNDDHPSDTVNVFDVPSYDEWLLEGTTEPVEPVTGDGSIIINNYDTLNIENTISGDAEIDFNGNANINVGAGAFGAGAFGAGAFGSVDVGGVDLDLSGNLEIAELNLSGDAITYQISGGNVYIIDGSSVEFPTYPPIEFPTYPVIELPTYPVVEVPTIDYDEVLSERELQDILTQETYYIPELVTENFVSLEAVTVPSPEAFPAQITSTTKAITSGTLSMFDDWGLTSVYTPLAIVTIVCFLLRGGK